MYVIFSYGHFSWALIDPTYTKNVHTKKSIRDPTYTKNSHTKNSVREPTYTKKRPNGNTRPINKATSAK